MLRRRPDLDSVPPPWLWAGARGGACRASRPDAKLVILAKHGLITWGETDEACYASTLATIAQARDYVEARITRKRAIFGGSRSPTSQEERRNVAAQIAPVLRGLVSRKTAGAALRRWR